MAGAVARDPTVSALRGIASNLMCSGVTVRRPVHDHDSGSAFLAFNRVWFRPMQPAGGSCLDSGKTGSNGGNRADVPRYARFPGILARPGAGPETRPFEMVLSVSRILSRCGLDAAQPRDGALRKECHSRGVPLSGTVHE